MLIPDVCRYFFISLPRFSLLHVESCESELWVLQWEKHKLIMIAKHLLVILCSGFKGQCNCMSC